MATTASAQTATQASASTAAQGATQTATLENKTFSESSFQAQMSAVTKTCQLSQALYLRSPRARHKIRTGQMTFEQALKNSELPPKSPFGDDPFRSPSGKSYFKYVAIMMGFSLKEVRVLQFSPVHLRELGKTEELVRKNAANQNLTEAQLEQAICEALDKEYQTTIVFLEHQVSAMKLGLPPMVFGNRSFTPIHLEYANWLLGIPACDDAGVPVAAKNPKPLKLDSPEFINAMLQALHLKEKHQIHGLIVGYTYREVTEPNFCQLHVDMILNGFQCDEIRQQDPYKAALLSHDNLMALYAGCPSEYIEQWAYDHQYNYTATEAAYEHQIRLAALQFKRSSETIAREYIEQSNADDHQYNYTETQAACGHQFRLAALKFKRSSETIDGNTVKLDSNLGYTNRDLKWVEKKWLKLIQTQEFKDSKDSKDSENASHTSATAGTTISSETPQQQPKGFMPGFTAGTNAANSSSAASAVAATSSSASANSSANASSSNSAGTTATATATTSAASARPGQSG